MKVLIVVPAHNESRVLGGVLDGLLALRVGEVLVVDDGSVDGTFDIARGRGVRVIRHFLNLGLGAALATGLEVARREGFDVVVTFDADGQHNPSDVSNLLARLEKGDVDVVVGNRSVVNGDFSGGRKNQPFVKRSGNWLLNVLNFMFFGVPYCDSQSGLRALNRKAIEFISINFNRYAVSSEILLEARDHGLRVAQVPIEIIYTRHSIAKGTKVKHGFEIFGHLLMRDLRGRE